MSNIPSAPETRKIIKDAINEVCKAFREIDDKKSFISDIKTRVKDQTGFTPADLEKYAKAQYLRENNSKKFEENREYCETMWEELEILFK